MGILIMCFAESTVIPSFSDEERSSFAFGRATGRNRRSESADEEPNELTRPENQDCGLHPLDIFLTRLFDEIERKQVASLVNSNEPSKAEDTYGRLLYSFTLLHMTSPKAYKQLINAVTLWDLCKSKQKQLESPLPWFVDLSRKTRSPRY
ncbi:hypothetical protein FBUS_01778 [Fasciolopsis buskii]|uniref:Uncharacterized protein n=1 Tax=Fasciolopsis buskii TaxID=27845 RepID=A0A8E0S1I3_9TREM|nr:hypothetical protein FBUS_01778 [Fasciolopsis buski]